MQGIIMKWKPSLLIYHASVENQENKWTQTVQLKKILKNQRSFKKELTVYTEKAK